jgi:hypothetical protein
MFQNSLMIETVSPKRWYVATSTHSITLGLIWYLSSLPVAGTRYTGSIGSVFIYFVRYCLAHSLRTFTDLSRSPFCYVTCIVAFRRYTARTLHVARRMFIRPSLTF